WKAFRRPGALAAGARQRRHEQPRMTEQNEEIARGGEAAGPAPESGTATTGLLARGVEVIRGVVKTLPQRPGVYRMLDAKGDALYVGKARQLKSRVANYLHLGELSNRLRRMVAETAAMEVVVTHTEVEALLLESNLIK